ncbi:hypothetical protein Cme02nite_09260 [Catellatospora methionotrophica]|uniref:Uncharacterized protein n=1 Tax=Catellatospora methionotrophica TaxID=121620 RepID=A0A8J3LBG7_9ACTN|nr:hypothetical protein [Catellatospora methionotrophica]GIG12594.1 hypothetical protein Cme02nite_09260 [Catellatospora methionotrophica]
MVGRYCEDFTVGNVCQHLREEGPVGRLIVDSGLSMVIVLGLTGARLRAAGARCA